MLAYGAIHGGGQLSAYIAPAVPPALETTPAHDAEIHTNHNTQVAP